jgi:hypothetical protein
MNISEQQIAQALEGHFWTLYFEPTPHVVDAHPTSKKKAAPGKVWTDDEYRTLWKLRMDGWTIEQAAEHMDRSACALAKVWGKRRDWQRRVMQGAAA